MGHSGLSTFDLLGDIPASQRTLMRLFLRRIEMSAAELEQAVAELPEEKRMKGEELEEALAVLLNQGWLVHLEQNGQKVYSVKQQGSSR
jgi:hypothetical protein